MRTKFGLIPNMNVETHAHNGRGGRHVCWPRMGDFMASHDVVEVMPEKTFSILAFGLEVAANNCHDALVGFVVYVAGHGGSFGDTFDIIGHDPSMLEIPPGCMHLTKADLKHFENENFVRLVTLAWELIPLNIGPSAHTSKLGDAIHNS